MIVLALLLAFFPQSGVPEYEGSCSSSLLARDTSEAGVRAWKERNQRVWEALQQDKDEDTLELVGRWPFAGAYRVRPSCNFAQDSVVYMSSGSGIRILKASDPRRPQMLGQVNCRGSLYGGTENGTGFVSRDTFLYVLYGYTCGLQVFSVANPSSPSEVGNLGLSTQPTGIALSGSFAIVVGWDSLLRVVNIADPHNLQQVATLLLPDEALGVDVKGNYAFVACGHAGLVSVDISNPLSPLQRGQVAGFTGIWPVCDTARDYAYVAGGAGGLHVVDIADPSNLYRVSTLASTPTIDIFKADTFVYLTGTVVGYQSDLFVVSVANPAQPRLIGQSRTYGWSYSACALSPFSYAYTCDGWEGLHVISLANPASPVVDTAMWGAWVGEDLAVQGGLVFFTNENAGLKVISVADPTKPVEIGSYDTLNNWDKVHMVAVSDSFAYISWFNMQSGFRSIDVSDPTHPVLAGAAPDDNQGKAVVIRDTFAFVAQDYFFEVYNIARPRQPVRIGRCDLTGTAWGMWVQETLAYVAPNLNVVSISDPANPVLLSASASNSGGVAVKDTFAYCAAWESLEVFSVANPRRPRKLAAVPFAGGSSIDMQGSVLYVGGYRLEAFDIADPVSPVRVAVYETPYGVRRIRHDSTYVFAACADGGLCIFRSCTTAVAEGAGVATPDGFRLLPNPTSGVVVLTVSGPEADRRLVSVRDAVGREVLRRPSDKTGRCGAQRLDLSRLPDGCYFVMLDDHGGSRPLKVVVSKRR